jgi:hypothetical protein
VTKTQRITPSFFCFPSQGVFIGESVSHPNQRRVTLRLDGIKLHFSVTKNSFCGSSIICCCSLSHPKNHHNVATHIQTNNSRQQNDVLERSDGLGADLVVTSSAGIYGRLFESSSDPICVERHGVKQNSTEMSKINVKECAQENPENESVSKLEHFDAGHVLFFPPVPLALTLGI